LDLRELAWWARQARRTLIEAQLGRMRAARLAMVSNDDYQRAIAELEACARALVLGVGRTVRENWEALRMRGRG